MEIGDNWEKIRRTFDDAFKSSFHFAVATVNRDGTPHVTPIGGLFLRDDRTGFYFEEFPSRLTINVEADPHVSILAVNSDKIYWGKSLLDGRFASPPAVRLNGTAGPIRGTTSAEKQMFEKRVGFTRGMKGHKIMWEGMSKVRDVFFDSFEPVCLGEMTDGLF